MVRTVLLCSLLVPVVAAAGDYDGTWNARVTKATSDCKSMGKEIEGNYTAFIRQVKGPTLTMTIKESGRVFHGVQAPGPKGAILHLVASYLEEAGIISQEMTIEMADADTGSGYTHWNWSDGLMICGGQYDFTLQRTGPLPDQGSAEK
jgi:hypothetical protein